MVVHKVQRKNMTEKAFERKIRKLGWQWVTYISWPRRKIILLPHLHDFAIWNAKQIKACYHKLLTCRWIAKQWSSISSAICPSKNIDPKIERDKFVVVPRAQEILHNIASFSHLEFHLHLQCLQMVFFH